MQGKEITLSTGEEVFVATWPQKLGDILRKQYPDPPIPIKEDTEHPTATGEPVFYEDPKDPKYLLETARVKAQRNLKWGEGQLLFGLPNIRVPEDWEPPTDDIQYFDPDWQPRPGEKGRKIDYIEWELLKNPKDMGLFFTTIYELAGLEGELEEAAGAVEDSFPGDLEGEGD